MNIPDLEAFIAVVETGSIVAASSRLNLTQPGVTRRVQNLESSLGTSLLNRHSKPLRPTSAGETIYEQGRRVLRLTEDMKACVSPRGEIGGELRIGILPYLSEAALAAPIDRLRGDFPSLALRVTSGWSPRLMQQVLRNELDAVALCLTDTVSPPAELVADDLGRQSVFVIASNRIKVPTPATLSDLAQFPWIMNENGCGFRASLAYRFEAERLPFHVAVEALSTELRMSLVARGLGLGMVTPAAYEASPWRAAVTVIETIGIDLHLRAWLLRRPPDGRLARPIRTFREALAEGLNPSAVVS